MRLYKQHQVNEIIKKCRSSVSDMLWNHHKILLLHSKLFLISDGHVSSLQDDGQVMMLFAIKLKS